MTLLYVVTAWIAGLFLASSGETSAGAWILLGGIGLALAYAARRERSWRLGFVCAAFFAFGAGRYAWAARPLPADHIAHAVDSGYVTLTGVIARDADVRDQHTNLHVKVELIRQRGEKRVAQGFVLVQAPRHEDYAYGDRVTVSGALLTPPEFDDFSYRDYLARRGIHALMPDAQVTLLDHSQGRPWLAAMYALKERAQRTINRLLPSPEAPLLSGILLGVESGIPEDVREDFNRTGTAHIIAISGANMIIVIGVLMALLQPSLGRKRAGWVTLGGVAFYTVFVGADPAVMRAALMGGLALIAAQTGRRAHGLTSLAAATWFLTLLNPMILWDIGFQLSAAATAGVVLFGQKFTGTLDRVLQRGFARPTARQISRFLAEPVAISLAAQIATTPLILLYFDRLSVISLVANLLIVPAQAYVMIFGWLAVLAGMVWTVIGEPLAWVIWLPLTYTLHVVHALARFEWGSLVYDFSPSSAWAVYAVLLAGGLIFIQHPDDRADLFRRLRQRVSLYAVLAAGLILAILVWAVALDLPDGRLHVWFLDVGQGHAVLVETPDGASILIDGGPSPTRLSSAVGSALPFWDDHLDLLIVTQPDDAAMSALPALFDRYNVSHVLTNGQTANSDSYRALTRAWEREKIRVQPVSAGYHVQTSDGVLLEVLHPQVPPDADTPPETVGLVLRIRYGDASFLITPELNAEAERAMLDAGWYLGSTVLELPSHGSDEANPTFFIQAVNPQAAVVSVGAGNRLGLPDASTEARLESRLLYRTDQHGTVEIVTDGRTLWIYTTD